MLSLSDNEFAVIDFLVRNFYEKLTIRSIAIRLKFSPAGVFNILKKLEKEGIVRGEKLGTGLFYSMNFENRIAEHLAAVVLLHSDDKILLNLPSVENFESVILHKKTLLVIGNVSSLDISVEGYEITAKAKEQFTEGLRKREQVCAEFLSKGTVISGEQNIVAIIKGLLSR